MLVTSSQSHFLALLSGNFIDAFGAKKHLNHVFQVGDVALESQDFILEFEALLLSENQCFLQVFDLAVSNKDFLIAFLDKVCRLLFVEFFL